MRSKRFLIVAAAAVVALVCSAAVSLSQARTGATEQTDEGVRAEHAASVLGEIMEAPDQGIPEGLLKKAYGIAVIPQSVAADLSVGKVSAAAMGVMQPFLRALEKYVPAEVPKTTRKQ
jgi:lipid-binding SYLF domain-containing protein